MCGCIACVAATLCGRLGAHIQGGLERGRANNVMPSGHIYVAQRAQARDAERGCQRGCARNLLSKKTEGPEMGST